MQAGSTPTVPNAFEDIQLPDTADMQLQLQQLVQQGVITPEQAQSSLAGSSDLNNISTDPALKSAQMGALSGLENISNSGGLTDTDKANLAKIQTDNDTQSRGARDAIIQGADARGVGGSGLELLDQLKNAQDTATRKSAADMGIAGQAQDRALQALISAGTTAGNIQNQDFSQKATVAGANDAISKFNAQNQQATNLANTSANNNAQAANLQAKQNVANTNVGTSNAEQQYNKNLAQQNFNNQVTKAGGTAQNNTTNAQIAGQNSQNQANATNQTIGTALTAASMFSDERMKEDVKEFDPSEFLDKLTNYKFKYKDKKHGAGEYAGPVAQDLEKSEIGASMVHDTPEGKMVDTNKAAMAALGALSHLNKKVKHLEGKKDV